MIEQAKQYFDQYPLRSIIILALIFRLLAAIFSQGYGMQDDHFMNIEAPQSWVDGEDYNNWLPENSIDGKASGHSLFYIGLHFLFFSLLELIGISNPEVKMYLVRLIHALMSLGIVYAGYRIAERIATLQVAKTVGLILALGWFFPYLSVHNLVEYVSVLPLLAGSLYLIKNKDQPKLKYIILAGLLGGIAISTRVQTALFVAGNFFVLLTDKAWRDSIIYGISSFASFFLTQIQDLFLWGRPFAELIAYFEYNSAHANDYLTQPWYLYIMLVSGLLVAPFSLFLIFGYFRVAKKHLFLFLPSFLFFVFHSMFPNKQERFIIPFIPYLIILGSVGLYYSMDLINKSKFFSGLYRFSRSFFWILNIIALFVFSFAYTKRSRVEAMNFLRERGDVKNFILESSHTDSYTLPPLYYLDQWVSYPVVTKSVDLSRLKKQISLQPEERKPNYVLFTEETNIEERITDFKALYPDIEFVAEIKAGNIDLLLHYLNPNNRNESCYIYTLD